MGLNLYWAACRLDIPSTKKSLLRHIALSYNEEHERACHASLETLAAHTGLDKSTIVRATKWLEDMELLVVERGGGRGAENLYSPVLSPNSKVKAIGKKVAGRDSFDTSSSKETDASRSETVAESIETVAEHNETVALSNPKGTKEKKEKERPENSHWGNKESERELEPYERPEYLASFSEKDAWLVIAYHRHGKEKIAKVAGAERTERIAALIAEAQEQKRFGVEKDDGAPTITPTDAASAPEASVEAKAKTEGIHSDAANAVCPMRAYDGNVIPLAVAGYFKRQQTTAAEFRELLIVGGITPERADARILEVAAAHGELGALQFMRHFINRHGAAIGEERRAARTSGAIASAVRWFKPAQRAA